MGDGERTRLRRLFSAVEHRKFRRLEQLWWTRVAGIAVTSDRELPVIRSMRPTAGSGRTNPSTLSTSFPAITSPTPVRSCSWDPQYRPNVDAVTFLLNEVLPDVLQSCPTPS